MAENEDFSGDHLAAVTGVTSFSQLLFADEDHYDVDRSSHVFSFNPRPRMLSFSNQQKLLFPPVTCTDSSSASSKSKTGTGSDQKTGAIKEASALSLKPLKKIKASTPSSSGHAKRKQKLGERITALQQLVSPFGKTDTASVLHEAMGYIKFLQEQVQVLCSPYLQHQPSLSAIGGKVETKTEDLRSRGLCLIPVDCSLHLADYTVADFWSPATEKKI